jgi:predicted  nucleic acid-binding Zn-ribbon protein
MTTDARISKLEAQIDRLEAKEAELRSQLAKAQLDQWYARIEDLELQAHLGAMETQDRIRALMAQVRQAWQDAKRQVEGTASSASEVVDDVRTRIEGLIQDLRRGMADASDKPEAKAG